MLAGSLSTTGIPVLVGRGIEVATLMRGMATILKTPIIVSDNALSDLTSRFDLATVDVTTLPWDKRKVVRCVAVIREKPQFGDGEWLYLVNSAPLGEDSRWQDIVRPEVSAAHRSTSHSRSPRRSPSTHPSSPATTSAAAAAEEDEIIEDIKRLSSNNATTVLSAMRDGPEGLMMYAVQRMNTALVATCVYAEGDHLPSMHSVSGQP
jgi:hypothetical protein